MHLRRRRGPARRGPLPRTGRLRPRPSSRPTPTPSARAADIAFLAVPHTAAMAIAPACSRPGLTVIDLSADFRLNDPALYAAWYETPHTAPALLDRAVYGLPELWRDAIAGRGPRRVSGLLSHRDAPRGGTRRARRGSRSPDARSSWTRSRASRGPAARRRGHALRERERVGRGVQGRRRTVTRPRSRRRSPGIAGRTRRVAFTPHLVPMTEGCCRPCTSRSTDGLHAEDAVRGVRGRAMRASRS